MTAQEHVERLRVALSAGNPVTVSHPPIDLRDVLAHIDQQAAEIERLKADRVQGEPERKPKTWVTLCSACGWESAFDPPIHYETCPNCEDKP